METANTGLNQPVIPTAPTEETPSFTPPSEITTPSFTPSSIDNTLTTPSLSPISSVPSVMSTFKPKKAKKTKVSKKIIASKNTICKHYKRVHNIFFKDSHNNYKHLFYIPQNTKKSKKRGFSTDVVGIGQTLGGRRTKRKLN